MFIRNGKMIVFFSDAYNLFVRKCKCLLKVMIPLENLFCKKRELLFYIWVVSECATIIGLISKEQLKLFITNFASDTDKKKYLAVKDNLSAFFFKRCVGTVNLDRKKPISTSTFYLCLPVIKSHFKRHRF